MYAAKVLVVFYSRTGTTRRAASALAEMLNADVEEIVVTRSRAGPFGYLRSLVEAINRKPAEIVAPKRDPSAYDLVVIGSPVWAGCVSSPMRAYLDANQRRLPRVAFFCNFAQRGADSALGVPLISTHFRGQPPVGPVRLLIVAPNKYIYKSMGYCLALT